MYDSPIPDREAKLAYLEIQIEKKKLCVHYWLVQASPEVASLRTVTRGDGSKWSKKELMKDALDTAGRHIRQFEGLAQIKAALVKNSLAEYERAQRQYGFALPLHMGNLHCMFG